MLLAVSLHCSDACVALTTMKFLISFISLFMRPSFHGLKQKFYFCCCCWFICSFWQIGMCYSPVRVAHWCLKISQLAGDSQTVMNSRNQDWVNRFFFFNLIFSGFSNDHNIPHVSMVTLLFSIYTAANVQLHFCFSYFGTVRTKCHSLKWKTRYTLFFNFFFLFNNAAPNWGKTEETKQYTKEVPCKYTLPIC